MTVYAKHELYPSCKFDGSNSVPEWAREQGYTPCTKEYYEKTKYTGPVRDGNSPPHSENYDSYRNVVVYDQSDPFGKW